MLILINENSFPDMVVGLFHSRESLNQWVKDRYWDIVKGGPTIYRIFYDGDFAIACSSQKRAEEIIREVTTGNVEELQSFYIVEHDPI